MNPFPPYQFTQPRDKTKSYFQPSSQNPFSTSQVSSQSSSTTSQQQNSSSSSTYQSDKYKSYYTEYHDYRSQSVTDFDHHHNNGQQFNSARVSEVQPVRYFENETKLENSNRFNSNTNNNTSPNSLFHASSKLPHHQGQQKSLQRKRFYTVTQHQKPSYPSTTNPFHQIQQQAFSQSMIVTSTNRPSSLSKQQIDPKKDLYRYVNQKFAGRVESQYNSREKREDTSANTTRTEYLDKANKKVSLKRDIAPISPKYQSSTTATKYPPSQHSFISINNKFTITNNNTQNTNNNQAQQPHSHLESSTTSFAQSIPTQEDTILPSTLQRFSSSSENDSDHSISNKQRQKDSENSHEVKPVSFKKNNSRTAVSTYDAQRPVTTYDKERTTPSSQSSVSQQMTDSQGTSTNTTTNPSQTKYFGSIRSNTPNPKLSSSSSHQLIDQQLYTDMKISRIQESTSNLEQKISSLSNQIHLLVHQSREHQTSITSINEYITKQQEEGITPQDIKRIKKQLKIMKTNFETAFTSMTDQINRKLTKQENIMKSLSDQIRLVAEENQKLNDTIERKNRKVDSLEKSMTSFMRQNQERMQNLVLNESFSSSKRSRNHSFEYGLDLKNMSSDDNYNSGKSYNSNNNDNTFTLKKLESIEKEIKKMKVFHIEEQENHQQKYAEIKREMEKIANEQTRCISRNQTQQIVRQTTDQILSVRLQNWSMVYDQKESKRAQRLKQELDSIKTKIQELNKVCHQELYDYRMAKLNQVPAPKFVTQSKIKTMNSEMEQQMGELQAKQRSLLVTLTEFQQKLISFEDRQHGMFKNLEDHKLKELKLIGDLREQQMAIKEINQILNGFSSWKTNQQTLTKEMGTVNAGYKGVIVNLQSRVNQIDRINAIQTENIESINNEFERVINKEIIPKFGEINHLNFEINQKIHSLTTDVTFIKKINESSMSLHNILGSDNSLTNSRFMGDPKELQQKIEQFFEKNMEKFTNQKVKMISTKLLSSKSPLSKIGLFKDKKQSDSLLQNNMFKKNSIESDYQIGKEDTYLLDEDMYLMDWEGAYLMEVDEFGGRRKIKVTEEELYFMEVNGLEIKKPVQMVN